jgi:hypothetical protein
VTWAEIGKRLRDANPDTYRSVRKDPEDIVEIEEQLAPILSVLSLPSSHRRGCQTREGD